MNTALSININKIALIRNSREGNYPDLIEYARQCIDLGAAGVTVHPRPDQRHIRASDIAPLSALCNPLVNVEFNIEGNPFADANGSYPGFMALVEANTPDQATLVPDNNSQLTSDHGFDLATSGKKLAPIIRHLKDLGVRVSLFMDPDADQIRRAADIGADRIELYTGPYAWAYKTRDGSLAEVITRFADAAEVARTVNLGVNAGHDLNLDNLPALRNAIPHLLEVSIGHAFTVDCIQMGIAGAMSAYLDACIKS